MGSVVLFILLWGVGLVGWIVNIFKLVGCDFSDLGAEVILRIVGIFVAPLGSILGFVGHF